MTVSKCRPQHLFRLASRILPLFLVLGGFSGLSGCSGGEVKGQNGPQAGRGGAPQRPVVVTAARAMTQAVPLEITDRIGTVEPIASVTIRARIGGQLEKVHFKEGDEVKQGDLLFTLDRRPLEAELRQAQANLARDQAQAANARSEARRYQDLIKRGAVATSDYEKVQANFTALEATVRADQAAIENARLQLGYTEIRSPISGLTGSLKVDQGNLVKANDTELVTINQITPIYVTFSVDEERLPEIRRHMGGQALGVRAAIPNDPAPPELGALTFIENTVTPGSGQILLRGTFANTDHRLWPGQFVSATLQLTTQSQALIVPSTALQNGQEGTFVFVISSGMTVEMRPVVVDRQLDGVTVIAHGLKAGEQVVTDGQLQLVPSTPGNPGSTVEIKTASPRPPASKEVSREIQP